jgi:uncharacterized protein (DUF779 family)
MKDAAWNTQVDLDGKGRCIITLTSVDSPQGSFEVPDDDALLRILKGVQTYLRTKAGYQAYQGLPSVVDRVSGEPIIPR